MLQILVTIEMESLWKEHYRNSDWKISLPEQLADSVDFLVMNSWGLFFFFPSLGEEKNLAYRYLKHFTWR